MDESKSEKQRLDQSLVNSITSENLKDIAVDGSELALDSFLSEGILKDIPFFGSVYKAGKAIIGIRDAIFAKKVYKFLVELKDIPVDERRAFIDEIDGNEKIGQKVGEKLIIIIDQLDDLEKPQIVGRLFKAKIKGFIDYETFLRLSLIVQKSFLPDLKKLTNRNGYNLTNLQADQFLSLGILTMSVKKNPTADLFARLSVSNNDRVASQILNFQVNELGRQLVLYGFTVRI